MSKNDVFPSTDSAGKSAAGALAETRPPATGGEDGFISYSRKDKVFVQKLHQALAEGQRDTWVDWEDIPRTADWWSEIEAGIEAANTFIFIISPDSVASEVCRREIAHAAKHHKRLVPIVHRDSPTEAVPEVLARLNYVFCRDSDDFDQAFQELLAALDTDLDWVKAHTRLLVRAREWEKHSRNDSFVLRGVDLEEAEQRLAQVHQNPEPTTLQREYVLASRKSATRRQRIALAAVTFGLIVAIVLGSIAYRNFRTAEAERNIAFSRELAANALAQLPFDAELGRLLAIEAASKAKTTEVERALRQAALNPLTTVLRGHTRGVNSAAFSPDGKWAITASIDESVRVWYTATWKTVAVLPGNLEGEANETFSPDGRIVVIGSADERTAWDTDTWQKITIPAGLEEKVAPPSPPLVPGEKVVASSPDGKYTLTSSDDGKVQVRETETRKILHQSGGDTPMSERLRQLTNNTRATLSLSPDGQRLITRRLFSKEAELWRTDGGGLVDTLQAGYGWIWAFAFSPDSRLVATTGGYPSNSVRVWDIMSKQTQTGFLPVVELHGHASQIHTVNFSPDSKLLITAGDDNTARIWEPGVGQNRIWYLKHKDHPTVYSTAFSPDGRFLVVARGTAVRVWDTSSGQQVHLLEGHTGRVRSAVYSPDGQYIITASDDKTVRVWEAGSGHEVRRLEGHTGPVRSAVYNPDGQYIVTASDDKTVRVWEAGNGQEVLKLEGQSGFTDAEFSPDGTLVVTTGWLPGVRVWEARTGHIVVEELHGHTEHVNSVAFSPDGKFVVTASGDRTAKIWETATGRLVADLLGHFDKVHQATFSFDGRFVLTASGDHTARLWDAQTGQSLLVFRGHSSDVRTARFSPDGKLIAMGSDDGTVQVFVCEVCGGIEELKHLAQQRVFRELTCEERQRFLHEQVTCPTPTPIAR
jgi:WD40 repeat protein